MNQSIAFTSLSLCSSIVIWKRKKCQAILYTFNGIWLVFLLVYKRFDTPRSSSLTFKGDHIEKFIAKNGKTEKNQWPEHSAPTFLLQVDLLLALSTTNSTPGE